MTIQIIAISIDLVIAFGVMLASPFRSSSRGGRSLSLLALFTALWCLAGVLVQLASLETFRSYISASIFVSAAVATSAEFTYALWRSDRQSWVRRLPLAILAIIPLVTQILFWVPTSHAALFASNPQTVTALFLEGAWGKANAVYIFSLMGASALLLWNTFLERPYSLPMPVAVTLIGALMPPAFAILEFTGFKALGSVELLPLGFTIACICFVISLFQRGDAVPSIDRNAVVEGMDDGWIVLDNQNIVVDMNSAAERMAGQPRAQVLGRPVTVVLNGMPNLGQTFNLSQELEMKRSIKSEDGWKYLNIRISPLRDRNQKPFGRLALWHDVTERKLTEDARQRARDEMLVLLNAISGAASNVVDLDEFLSESIYYIIYPFRSQVVAFYLLNDKADKKQSRSFVLSAHLGLSPESAEKLALIPAASSLFADLLPGRQPVQIENVQVDERVPPELQGMGLSCLLMVPLTVQSGDESEMLGCMCLGRKESPIFSPDEFVRLTMIADQIAVLIEGDRRRKLAITSSERKKVMRDLHDSLSQKLYGLVTTTEAAQAQLEAGTAVDTSEVLARIGENARQAVKEMRLFLFQMQPIDMEKDGLISLLHHRLAAVEGRANIKAQFHADLTDDEVALSKQTEVVLYYIAMEALNNVLRHAAANSVFVTLRQGRRNVILEIRDDGCGFDAKQVERGGLGLPNMHDRTEQIHGKLQILSKPDQGTKVVVTVPRDLSVKPVKHRRLA